LTQAAHLLGVVITRIGTFRSGSPSVVVFSRDASPMVFKRGGWSHF